MGMSTCLKCGRWHHGSCDWRMTPDDDFPPFSYIGEAEKQITALRAEVERLTSLYNGRMSDLHAAQDREMALQSRLDEAIHRIEDMLEDDDGQAWKEASKFLLRAKEKNHE